MAALDDKEVVLVLDRTKVLSVVETMKLEVARVEIFEAEDEGLIIPRLVELEGKREEFVEGEDVLSAKATVGRDARVELETLVDDRLEAVEEERFEVEEANVEETTSVLDGKSENRLLEDAFVMDDE